MQGNSAQTRDYELLRLSALGLMLLIYRAWNEFIGIGSGSGSLISGYGFSPKWLAAAIGVGLIFVAVAVLCAWALLRPRTLLRLYARWIEDRLAVAGAWRYVFAAGLACLPSVALLGDWGKHLTTPAFRMTLMVLPGLLSGLVLSSRVKHAVGRVGLMILVTAAAFAVSKRLVQITDYPFKLFWSEGNRLWDYSLYFARDRYQIAGQFEFPSYLTPGRHGLWGLPFLIPGVGIAALRFWDAFLWLGPAAALGWVLFGSLQNSHGWRVPLAAAMWAMLFLTQIGIYAPLTLSVLIVVWKSDPDRPVRSAAFAALAGLYAGLSRWTWAAAPAVIVGLWLLLLGPGRADRRIRLLKASAVGLSGLVGGVVSQVVMAVAFPKGTPIYSTSLSQPLLWNRLLPNATSEQGILLAALIALGPLLAVLVWTARQLPARWGWLEISSLALSLVTFLAVGLVASVKIGGGSNLHNLDMFAIALMAVVGLVAARLLRERSLKWEGLPIVAQALLMLAVIVPSFDVMRTGGPLQLADRAQVEIALGQIREQVELAARQGEVLFIDQRQLLTFGQVPAVPLVMEYELKDLMNQAMGSNAEYLDRFQEDLAVHRFVLILSDPLPGFEQGIDYEFGEENDVWLRYIAAPLQQNYEVALNVEEAGLRLLVPRAPAP